MHIDRLEIEKLRIELFREFDKHLDDLDVSDVELQRYIDSIKFSISYGARDIQCSEFVKGYIKQKKLRVTSLGIYQDMDLVQSHRALFYEIHEAWKVYKASHKLKTNFSREEVGLEFESIADRKTKEGREDLREYMDPIDNPELFDQLLTRLCWAICGQLVPDKDSVEFRRAKAFVGHFIWSVQMKLHKGVENTLLQGNQAMLMFVSTNQKTGKSTATRLLLEPIGKKGFVWKADFVRLEDQFSIQNLAFNYVAVFDDAARSNIKSMSKFKQVVTEDEIHFRGMYSATEHRFPKIATLIATSNKTARELVNDTTGLRRFHQVLTNNESVDTGRGIDLNTICKMDMRTLWRTVPLDETSPLFKYLTPEELNVYESESRPRSTVESWLRDMQYSPGTREGGAELKPAKPLYESYKEWGKEAGIGPNHLCTRDNFITKLKELGAEAGRTSAFRGVYIYEDIDI